MIDYEKIVQKSKEKFEKETASFQKNNLIIKLELKKLFDSLITNDIIKNYTELVNETFHLKTRNIVFSIKITEEDLILIILDCVKRIELKQPDELPLTFVYSPKDEFQKIKLMEELSYNIIKYSNINSV